MKKLLLSSLMLAAGIFAASAAEATIDFSQQGWSNEFEITASTPIGDSGLLTRETCLSDIQFC